MHTRRFRGTAWRGVGSLTVALAVTVSLGRGTEPSGRPNSAVRLLPRITSAWGAATRSTAAGCAEIGAPGYGDTKAGRNQGHEEGQSEASGRLKPRHAGREHRAHPSPRIGASAHDSRHVRLLRSLER